MVWTASIRSTNTRPKKTFGALQRPHHLHRVFLPGQGRGFGKIRQAALKLETSAKAPGTNLLRELDPRQRRLLNRQGSATSGEMAKHFKLSHGNVVDLCRAWVASGFLEMQNPFRKARSYRLAERLS
jgi:hypothetical protein